MSPPTPMSKLPPKLFNLKVTELSMPIQICVLPSGVKINLYFESHLS